MTISRRISFLLSAHLYVAAFLLVAMTIVLRLSVGVSFRDRPLLLTFVIPILLSAYIGGLGPGLCATGLSAVATLFWLTGPVHDLSVVRAVDLSEWGVLLIVGVLISTLSEGLHRAVGRAQASRQENVELLARQRADEARQAETERFRKLINAAPIGIVFGTVDGEIVWANDEYLRILGCQREDVAAGRMRWDQLTPAEWLKDARAAIDALGTRQTVRYEKEYTRQDGTRIPVLVGLVPHNGMLAGFVLDLSREKRAERELRFFRHFVEHSMDPLYALSPAAGFRFTYVNDATCRHFGRAREELLGMSIPEWDPLFPIERCEQFLEEIRQRRSINFETIHRHADGHEIPVEISVTVIEYEGEELLAGWFNDITERKRVERDLRESEEKFRTLAENAQAAFGIVQGDRFVYANRYLAEATGYSLEEITSMPFLELVHPAFRQMLGERATQRQKGVPVPNIYEFVLVTKAGEPRWIEMTTGLIQYHGKPAVIGAGFDVTARKRAEEALRASEERLRLAIESARLFAWEYDARTRRWSWTNPEPSWGRHARSEAGEEEFMGSVHPEDRDRVRELFQQSLDPAGPGQYAAEFRFRRPDGQYRWLSARGRTFFEDRDGVRVPVRSLGVSMDTTEQKASQEMLAAAKEQAEQARTIAEEASRAKDRFLAVLSHELRTPLTPVLAATSMLQRDRHLDGRMRDDLEMIRRNVELEARLIDDLLDLTRIVRGKVELDRHPLDVVTVVHRAVEVCQADLHARGLHFSLDPGSGPYLVDGDAGRLQQVFWNLLKNAIKFTPHGGCVGVRCGMSEGRVVVEVTDSGVGIDPADMEHIFDAFAQAEMTAQRKFGGLGLGLAISKSLVELHGGTIEASSPGPGCGATFRVELPALVREGARLRPAWSPPVAAATSSPSRRILVVEDHGDTAEMIQRILESEGHQVATAGDVATAARLIDEQRFDLLLSDLGLPDGSGLDLIRRVRSAGHMMPAIALSGYGQEQDLQQTRQAGFTSHLVKPVDMDRLLAAVEANLSQPAGS
ncbi:MAG TPA: PAS domain S-box protein [Phycisphaerae bacterium]|nr:PAS domain S-box protein [Phycisphaerae bacterium]